MSLAPLVLFRGPCQPGALLVLLLFAGAAAGCAAAGCAANECGPGQTECARATPAPVGEGWCCAHDYHLVAASAACGRTGAWVERRSECDGDGYLQNPSACDARACAWFPRTDEHGCMVYWVGPSTAECPSRLAPLPGDAGPYSPDTGAEDDAGDEDGGSEHDDAGTGG
jgi:hypothetical protein